MALRSNRVKQLWGDIDFIDKLEKIKAKRLLAGNPVRNTAQLTKEIINCPSFKYVEEELIKPVNDLEIKLKIDKKVLW